MEVFVLCYFSSLGGWSNTSTSKCHLGLRGNNWRCLTQILGFVAKTQSKTQGDVSEKYQVIIHQTDTPQHLQLSPNRLCWFMSRSCLARCRRSRQTCKYFTPTCRRAVSENTTREADGETGMDDFDPWKKINHCSPISLKWTGWHWFYLCLPPRPKNLL